MSLKLRKVELFNIRSHEHIEFEPEAEGITAIQGVNGSGKSTIVDSIAWALFGTKPNGVSKSMEIFKTGLSDNAKALARVDLEIDGARIRFERRRVNKQGTLECEVWSVTEENGEEKLTQLAGPAISHAEKYIRKLLRMDEQGFLASILVQQKQVDQLISASPRERGAVIERLTGIAGITSALVQSRQDFNALKKAASYSSIDEESLAKLRVQESTIRSEVLNHQSDLALLKSQALDLKTKGEGFKVQFLEATAKYDHKVSVERKIADLTTRIKLKKETLTETSLAKDAAKKAISGASTIAYDELSAKIEELDTKRDTLSIKKAKAEDTLSNLNNEKRELENQLAILDEPSGKTAVEIQEAISEIGEQKELLSIDIIEAKNQIEQIKSAITIIEHGDSCPTCLQTVSEPSVAVQALENTISILLKSIETNESTLVDAQLLFSALEGELRSLNIRTDSTKKLFESKNEVVSVKKILDSAGSDLRILLKELKSVNGLFDEAKKSKERQKTYKSLLDRAQSLTEEVEELEFSLNTFKIEDASLDLASQRSLNGLQNKLDEIRSKHSSVSVEYTKLTGELKMKCQKIEFLKLEITRHEEDVRKHHKLLKSVAVASHAVDLVSEFREERIRNSIPVIEVYASDLLSRFTDGKFNRLTLDQKFNATVYIADGTPRSVGLLSGGELSAAAMSLRLAISMLLNSGADQNMVILDEVLVSQDGPRAEQILATIKEMFKGQVVLIAHNESIDSIADRIISL